MFRVQEQQFVCDHWPHLSLSGEELPAKACIDAFALSRQEGPHTTVMES